ncbi:hypothetical protein GCM10026982_39490 [Nocardiopsis aegyptia]
MHRDPVRSGDVVAMLLNPHGAGGGGRGLAVVPPVDGQGLVLQRQFVARTSAVVTHPSTLL